MAQFQQGLTRLVLDEAPGSVDHWSLRPHCPVELSLSGQVPSNRCLRYTLLSSYFFFCYLLICDFQRMKLDILAFCTRLSDHHVLFYLWKISIVT